MAHPTMYREDDPLLARVRGITLGFPGAAEKVSHGRPTFYTGKVFAYYGGSTKLDGTWVEHGQSILVLPDRDEREALVAQPGVYVPGYLGAYGWVGLDLDGNAAGWDEVRELVDMSYRNTAGRRLVAELDSV